MISGAFVEMVISWSRLVFLEHFDRITPRVRAMRLLEEAMELAQAEDVTREETLIILEQVFGKIKGMPHKELGGLLMTIAAYAGVKQYDLERIFLDEFNRCMDHALMDRVRKRNLEGGDKIGLV